MLLTFCIVGDKINTIQVAGVYMKKLFNILIALVVVSALVFSAVPSVLASTNLVSNPSVESADNTGNSPNDWVANDWGILDANFTYVNSGQDGNKSVRVDVSNYQSGDAKWYFKPVTAQPNTTYTYRTYLKASVTTDIVMQVEHTNDTTTYQWLKTANANLGDWQAVSADYTTPADVSKVSVFHVVNSNGWLQTDNTSFSVKETMPTPTTGNLLPNASLETADDNIANKPAWWSSGAWGTNTANFTYEQTGQQGSRSVRTEITAFTNGDAKWFVDPVTIKPNQQYDYKHYYKSNVDTQVIAAYIDANGNYTYEWLRSVPSSANWSEMTVRFKTPANSQKVTLYNVVDKVGWLQIDNTSLTEFVVDPNAQPIPNGSLETVSSVNTKLPANWSHSKWGTNTAKFAYVQNGHTGSRSVKVTISNYTDGDAKWLFDPITTLTPGKQYRFTAWYKSNVAPKAVAMFNKADGTTQYFGLPDPFATGNAKTTWQQYSDTFTVPTDAVSTSVFLFINKNGWLQTDDYSISNYQPTGFSRPLVTMTFDDGHEDNVTTALPLLNQYGFKTTQCYATEFIEGVPGAADNVLAFFNSGHEVCSHTVTHPFMTLLNQTQLDYELSHSQQVLQNIIGQPVRNFASPYGDYNQNVNNTIDNYYQAHRTVDEGYNSKDNFNVYRLRVQNVQNTTTLAEYQSWLDKAKETNTWLILVYHRVAADAGQFDTYPADFAAQLQAVHNSGITVKTYQDALTETRAQL